MKAGSLGVGVAVGVLGLAALRFFVVAPPEPVHHHANFAVFIDGERLDLSGDRYMEDVASCSANPDEMRPQDRIHLHENDGDVVHVHDGGATWGHLMQNLGFSLGAEHFITHDGQRYFPEDDGRSIKFFVNRFQVPDLHNRVVGSEDRVLISIGSETPDEALETQMPQVAATAAEFNQTFDPAGCQGGHGPMSLRDRLRHAFLGG